MECCVKGLICVHQIGMLGRLFFIVELLLKDTFTLPYDIELIVMTVYNSCFA